MPMSTRRTFLAGALVGGAAALGGGLRIPGAAPSPSGTDPSVVAAINAGRTPTRWGTSLPGIATAFNTAGRQLALTFDACDRGCDEALLNALQTKNVPAALFICSKWIDGNPGRIDQLAANPLFEIGNHGTRHVPLSMTGRSAYGIAGTKSAAEVVDEVMTNQNRITALTGSAPSWFRAGTAHYDDDAVQMVHQLGLTPVGFSVNADNGATASGAAVGATMARAAAGSIVLAHMNRPRSRTAAGIAAAIPAMRTAGWEFVALSGQAVR